MKIALLCVLLLAGGIQAQTWVPYDYGTWANQNDTLERNTALGAGIFNYDSDSGWYPISNDWQLSGDSMAYVYDAVLKTEVHLDGRNSVTLRKNETDYALTQKLSRLIWIKTDTWNWVDVTGPPTWSTPSVDSNIITWANVFPGVNYKIRKERGRVQHGIVFKPAFLDSAVILYNQRADSLDIALGSVVAYTLTNVDNPDSAIGSVKFRRLKRFGRYTFDLSKQEVHFPGSDNLKALTVWQRWVRRGDTMFCVEYVPMKRLKQIHETYPNAVIWHNTETEIGAADCYDAGMSRWGDDGHRNDGGSEVFGTHPTDPEPVLMRWDLTALGSDITVSAVSCSLYTTEIAKAHIIGGLMTTEWTEGVEVSDVVSDGNPGVTFKLATDTYPSGTGDPGDVSWASSLFGAGDFTAGTRDTTTSGTGVWMVFDSSGIYSDIEDWANEDVSNYGWAIWSTEAAGARPLIHLAENSTAGYRPRMWVVYTSGAPGDAYGGQVITTRIQ